MSLNLCPDFKPDVNFLFVSLLGWRVLEVNAQGYNTMYTHLGKFNLFWQHFLKAAAEHTLLEKASEIPTVKENELKVYANQQNREVAIISRKHIIFQSDSFLSNPDSFV